MINFPVQVYTQRLVKHKLDVYVPIIHGLTNATAQYRINTSIMQAVNKMIQNQGYDENPDTEVSGYYEIKNNQRGILSLTLVNFAYSGGAHGITVTKSLTFDTQTGKKYKLKELFNEDSDYVKVLSDFVGKQIKDRDIPLISEYKGISPEQDFYIADKSLVLFFQLYDLTPYVYGFPFFPISVYDIQPIVKEDGPLGEMIS
ncbi:DUF3298 and DUF4163 domain-containing protein [Bacillus sp. CGMCC 1.16541]|uniref:DUF3298 and DUF4163 domain-containing protein n=1 Tax=Bacillus sp. CGMCC 1.16541 TaxID=2185143 RepID=UPI000D73CDD9|nr:DUF3298 and DUF4163 domain-containing protein [Bacillus sp. CGMCC 1.16541]